MIRVQGDKSHRSGGSTWAGNEFSLAFHQVLDMQIRRHFVEARHALDFVSKCVSRRPSNWRACKCRLIEWRERERRRISIQLLYTRKHFCPMAAVSIAYIYWYSGCVDCVWFPLFQTQRTEAKRSRDRKSESPVGWRTNPSGGCYRRGPVARLSKTVSRDFYKEPARGRRRLFMFDSIHFHHHHLTSPRWIIHLFTFLFLRFSSFPATLNWTAKWPPTSGTELLGGSDKAHRIICCCRRLRIWTEKKRLLASARTTIVHQLQIGSHCVCRRLLIYDIAHTRIGWGEREREKLFLKEKYNSSSAKRREKLIGYTTGERNRHSQVNCWNIK